jgi:hypothetical protein
MKRNAILRLLLMSLAAGLMLRPAQAQTITTFTSLQTWQAAVASSWQFSQNFQSFTKDTYFQTAPVTAGTFSLQQVGQDPIFGLFQNFVDVPPLQFTDNGGTTNAAIYIKSGVSTVQMTFGAPVFAWGANFYGAETGELVNLVLTTPGGVVLVTVPVTVDTGFFGFVISPIEGLSQITFTSRISNPDASVGQGFGLVGVTGAYISSPIPVSLTQVVTTASGLAYSRVTQTFNGTVTIKNVSSSSIGGPFQIVFMSLPSGVTLTNALGTYKGNPYITVNVVTLGPGQSATVSVQFSNPSNVTINVSPVIYSGGFK